MNRNLRGKIETQLLETKFPREKVLNENSVTAAAAAELSQESRAGFPTREYVVLGEVATNIPRGMAMR